MMINWTTWVLALCSACPEAPGKASAPQEDAQDARLLTFEAEAVDGVDVLVVRGNRVSIEHREWQEIEGLVTRVEQSLQREGGYQVVVRNQEGRSRVRVTQQPGPQNDYELRVLIDDGPQAGAAPLRFELFLVPGAAKAAARPHNIFLVTIDSLRPDRLGCYGHDRDTSPFLDRFAEQCVRYSNAFSTSSFTPPSHASLFTSKYVGDHGLLTWNGIPDEELTLSEVLYECGYRTGASTHLDLQTSQNLGQGIEWQREGPYNARHIVSDAVEFLEGAGDQPWFLWLHLYDVHRPYGRERNWTGAYADGKESGAGRPNDHYNLEPDDVEERGLTPEDLDHIVNRYDAGIAYTDAQLAPLLAQLSTPARRADTMVIVTADHGESLLDHEERLFTHDPFLKSAVTRIPLLIRYPGATAAGTVVDSMASLIDLAPTVLDVVGIPRPDSFMGVSLMQEDERERRKGLFLECWGWEQKKALRSKDWLLIHNVKTGRTECFDLRQDPGERRALPAADDPVATQMERRLQGFTRRPTATEVDLDDLDPALLERLRELGYIDR